MHDNNQLCCEEAIEGFYKTYKTQIPGLKSQVSSFNFRELSLISKI